MTAVAISRTENRRVLEAKGGDMMETASETALRAILSADAAGYAKLVWQRERQTLAMMNRCFNVFRDVSRAHWGHLVKTTGDGVLIEFASARAAVECAVSAQRAIVDLVPRAECGEVVQFRTGVHLGDVYHTDGDVFGNAVNIAVRLQEIAEPGMICVSEVVYDQVRTEIQIGFESLGLKELKNIAKPVSVYQVLPDFDASAVAPSIRELDAPLTLPERPSIVVLPFKSMSDVSDGELIADGLTEDLTTSLSRFRELFVISRNSAFAFKGRAFPIRVVGRQLGVRYVLEGSVRIVRQSVRITAQLIDAHDDRHLWVEKFDGNLTDIFRLQDEIIQVIASSLASSVDNEEVKSYARGQSSSFDAYRIHLRGRHLLRRLSPDTNLRARLLFEDAIKIDPGYARALASLSRTWNYDWQFSWGNMPDQALNNAMEFAQAAVDLDRRDPSAHAELGFTLLFLKRQEAAIEELETALSLNPNDPDIMIELSTAYTFCRRPDAAIELAKRAIRLNPHYPDSYLWYLADAYLAKQDCQAVVDTLTRMTNPALASRLLAASYAHLDRQEEARFWAARVRQIQPDFTISGWLAKVPETDEAQNEYFAEGLRKSGLSG